MSWTIIEAEARDAYRGAGRFPLPAYSEYMPPPYIGIKPYAPTLAHRACANLSAGDTGIAIDEYEQAVTIEPGLDQVAHKIAAHLAKHRGDARGPSISITPLALSRSQDDKGLSRWTLFGNSHAGAGAAFWHGRDEAAIDELLAWAGIHGAWAVLGDDVPAALAHRALRGALPKALITFTPFDRLPTEVRAAHAAHHLTLVPEPASLAWASDPMIARLATALPHAFQLPLLHLFPHVESSCALRVPPSGYLDENTHPKLPRPHRWERVARDADVHGDGRYMDHASVALFSTTPEAIDLYNKPLAKNAQVWTDDGRLVLDGPRAGHAQIAHAAGLVDRGGRFGYRMYYPPMRAGLREVWWHVPVIARADGTRFRGGPIGFVTAERDGAAPLVMNPVPLAREHHVLAVAEKCSRDARKLIEARDLLAQPVPPSYARALLHIAKDHSLDDFLHGLHSRPLAAALRAELGPDEDPGPARVLDNLGTRAFEEQVWTSIRGLAHGEFRQKNDADGIVVNRGKHGGPAAAAAHVHAHERRDLEALGDHLHARYRELIQRFGMTGRAECVDHVFRWESDHEFPWMEGWVKNQAAPAERNIVLMIPGRDRSQAIVMGDHYDTAYMEDVFYAETGGDALRAPAAGADDNHSATTALLLAAEQLLPLAAAGQLARDVWLVHLTGEEYPADCMGARALGQALVEKSLSFTGEDGSTRDVSHVECAGAFILDMVGHNTERDRDVFMIAPGEGRGSAHLALRAHRANRRWNARAAEWNKARHGLTRAQRVPDGPHPSPPPPPFAHLPLRGEVRVEWEPRSALFNTDGQIASDLGIPCVLFMENYDISRKGYHDTHDTMANIDLDYCCAVIAIAIETVADCACAESLTPRT